ncbi:MAG: glucoamylase family protein [Bryobacteraceae bacterium]
MRSGRAAVEVRQALRKPAGEDPNLAWLFENVRLIRTAEQDTKNIGGTIRKHPSVENPEQSDAAPRAYAIARSFLDIVSDTFDAEALGHFVRGIQEVQELQMGEVWAVKPMLQLAILERVSAALASGRTRGLEALIGSLREIGEADWKTLFEETNAVDPVLRNDPAGAYESMDFESRDLYRKTIAELASHAEASEREIAGQCVTLAGEYRANHGNDTRAAERRTHVGFYLLDAGVPLLRERIRYRAPAMQRVRDLVLCYPNAFYLAGIEIATFLVVVLLLSGLESLTPIVAGFFLLLIPATQAAVDFMNHLANWMVAPRQLPKLDFSEGIPEDLATMVAVPALLLNANQVRALVGDLEVRYLANAGPNLHFALLTDWPDAPQPTAEEDSLVDLCRELIENLNLRYSSSERTPFYLFHRRRIYNPCQGAWMGWERKRGKLLDLNQLLGGGCDSFPIKAGNTSLLHSIRYVITLDADTQLPRDSAHRLVGAMAHPLNRAVIDPQTRMVVEGYGILQPRIGISIQSASRSRLARIYSGQTGFDIYTRAVSDVYQDLYGEGIFTGKGIYEVETLRTVLERRFPENWLLSHDLIEGAYARAGLVSDIELIDDYPSHFSAYCRRKHRWVRGDWQILRWLFPQVPDADYKAIPNPTSVVSRWKMVDNARRSLFDPATVLLMAAGWTYLPGKPWFWTAAIIALLLMPVYAQTLFSVLRAPVGPGFGAWAGETVRTLIKGHFAVLLQLIFLLHQALLSLDAIIRSLLRTSITKRRLLDWETAAESDSAERRKSTVDVYLARSPWIVTLLGVAVASLRPEALPAAAPILVLWFLSPCMSAWLNRPPRAERKEITAADEKMLRLTALRTWRFFREHSNEATNWLIPDNLNEGSAAMANRLSPTNLGFLLNARIAGVYFGYLSLPEFARETRGTLDTVLRLPRFRGHLLNWYHTETLQPLPPAFVSTVDSGNLAACLWTLKQAARSWMEDPPPVDRIESGTQDIQALLAELKPDSPEAAWWRAELARRTNVPERSNGQTALDLHWVAETADQLVREMDFSFLYNKRKKVLSVGYDVAAGRLEPSSYGLLASESRIATFVAIAKGEVPQEAWFHLGRTHTVAAGRRVLLSWTGTMFEYLMPVIWMQHHRDTLLERSVRAAVAVQRSSGRRFGLPWGISESACGRDASSEYAYAAFGVPELALKRRRESESLVISPYSTFLALSSNPRAAVRNIRRMTELGWNGPYGFIEAADYGPNARGCHPIRTWMAHHQGMILLSICNLLADAPFQKHFHAEPHALATELLLHERVPRGIPVQVDEAIPAPALG